MEAVDSLVRKVGYHGTDATRAGSILGQGFVPSSGTDHWLGAGIYLFDDLSLTRGYAAERFGTAAVVLEVFYSAEHELDLTRYDVRVALSDYGRAWIERAPADRVGNLIQDAGRRQLDHAILDDVMAITNYTSVRAFFGTDGRRFSSRIFPPDRPLWQAGDLRSGLNLHDHVQVAIRDPSVILWVRPSTSPS